MTKQEFKEYEARVEHSLEGLTHVSTGACPGCTECGLEDEPGMDYEAYELVGESHFSRFSCECCNNPLDGDRYPAHAINPETVEVIHLNICTDCLMYLNYGSIEGN